MVLEVIHNRRTARFELHGDGELVGFADYHERDDTTVVTHVETVPQHRGKGCAAVLMAGLLDQLRADGRRVHAVCSYAVAYVRDHPDQHDLLA
ncbi:MAG: N-acetyltransferase [Acidimicrobiia bacterium]|nr:N-acetyltransferase [Acidimicrobiia bacterium]MDH5238567.1 N-acetyltransferase [Acidimicrobiia bacterium]